MTGAGGALATDEQRQALLRKYRVLARWRRAKDHARDHAAAGADGGGGAGQADRADRATMARLAAEFPGALRELDLLGLAELERRVVVLEEPRGAPERWIAWIAAYHASMRQALAIRRHQRPAAQAFAAPHAAAADAQAAAAADPELVRQVARPPDGRLAVLVLRRLAAQFGVPATEISATLFPPRRAAPYAL